MYPIELEQILLMHPKIEDVAVIGIQDEVFGQRLKAFVQLKKEESITTDDLLTWLKTQAARHQIPKEIVFLNEIPYTPVGKVNKKLLK